MLAVSLVVISAVYLASSLLVVAPRKAGYRHGEHTISEIGEVGAPDQRFVALGIFLPVGLVLLVVAVLACRASVAAAALALCIAIGYLAAAAFPCDRGAPLRGSSRQTLHNLGGAVEYFGGGGALLALAESYGLLLVGAAILVWSAAVVLALVAAIRVRGSIQRAAEMCLFGGLIRALA